MTNSAPLFEKLRSITEVLIDVSRPPYSLRAEVLELVDVFAEAGGLVRDVQHDIAAGETKTSGGVAISPTMASMCLDDFARTVQFIRGLHDAIRSARSNTIAAPVRVLYAGCGPWATLATPLMTIFAPDEATFTLLDIHSDSIDSAKLLTNALGISESIDGFVVQDALQFQIDEKIPPGIIVIEMLRAGLEAEPQVAACFNLLPQAPDAILVPEEVRIDLSLINRATEFSVEPSEEMNVSPGRDRVFLNPVLNLTKDLVRAFARSGVVRPTWITPVELPSYDRSRYQPMLLTTIRVYGSHVLSDYDSGITVPKALPVDVAPGDRIELRYEIGDSPGYRVCRT